MASWDENVVKQAEKDISEMIESAFISAVKYFESIDDIETPKQKDAEKYFDEKLSSLPGKISEFIIFGIASKEAERFLKLENIDTIAKKNKREIIRRLSRKLKAYFKARRAIRDTLDAVFDFYGGEVLSLENVETKLAKIIKEAGISSIFGDKKKISKDIYKYAKKIKTDELKASYNKIADDIMNSVNFEKIAKDIAAAEKEKARFIAKRIVATELARANESAKFYEILNDKEVEFVKFRLAGSHPRIDECDFFAKLDIGYGPGVYPKGKAPALPLHPFCRCFYGSVHVKPEKKQPVNEFKGMNLDDFRLIFRSKERALRFLKNGEDPIKLMNETRKKGYKIIPFKQRIEIMLRGD